MNVPHKRVRVLAGHTALARWLAECDGAENEDWPDLGFVEVNPELNDCQSASLERWNGKLVFRIETRQNRFEVFEIAPGTTTYPTHAAVCDAVVARKRST